MATLMQRTIKIGLMQILKSLIDLGSTRTLICTFLVLLYLRPSSVDVPVFLLDSGEGIVLPEIRINWNLKLKTLVVLIKLTYC